MSIMLNRYIGSGTNVIVPTTKDDIRITTIGSSCFASKSITNITGDSILEIGQNAFFRCSSLTTVSFPNCNEIYYEVFYNCSLLTTISLPNCNYIGGGAFYNTAWLNNQFSSSNIARLTTNYQQFIIKASSAQVSGDIVDTSTTFICGSAFESCRSLTTVSFPNCSYIADAAFRNCTSLTTISFPNCSYIDEVAFQSCTSLTTISFPNCNEIAPLGITGCTALTTAYFLSTSLTTLGFMGIMNCPALTSIYVKSSLLESYKTADNWSEFSSKLVGM